MEEEAATVCVLDASTYVGYWVLKGLLSRGYWVHAAIQETGDGEIIKKIKDMERDGQEKLKIFTLDLLDYHSLVDALNGCSGLFCCLDSPEQYDKKMVDMEVRGVINVMEACAQTYSIHKIVFSSSLASAIWRDNIGMQKDVDERCWSDQDYCRKLKLWYALAKTLSEQAAWALAVDRMLSMVSINAGLVLGPNIAQLNSGGTMSYLKGAPQMYENGVLASVEVDLLVDVHIRAFEDPSSCGRYLCLSEVIATEEAAVKLAEKLKPLITIPARYEKQEGMAFTPRLRTKKLSKLLENSSG